MQFSPAVTQGNTFRYLWSQLSSHTHTPTYEYWSGNVLRTVKTWLKQFTPRSHAPCLPAWLGPEQIRIIKQSERDPKTRREGKEALHCNITYEWKCDRFIRRAWNSVLILSIIYSGNYICFTTLNFIRVKHCSCMKWNIWAEHCPKLFAAQREKIGVNKISSCGRNLMMHRSLLRPSYILYPHFLTFSFFGRFLKINKSQMLAFWA